jgi:hypothetical protein
VRRVIRALLLAVAVLAACAQPRSARCKEICSREAECQQRSGEPDEQSAFDEGDCVAACAALERDEKAATLVEAHHNCVELAGEDCAKLAACK